MTSTPEKPVPLDANRLPVPLPSSQDRLADWVEAYLAHAVTTAPVSRRAQRRDLGRFLGFMIREEGTDLRPRWTPRLTRAFLDWMISAVDPAGRPGPLRLGAQVQGARARSGDPGGAGR